MYQLIEQNNKLQKELAMITVNNQISKKIEEGMKDNLNEKSIQIENFQDQKHLDRQLVLQVVQRENKRIKEELQIIRENSGEKKLFMEIERLNLVLGLKAKEISEKDDLIAQLHRQEFGDRDQFIQSQKDEFQSYKTLNYQEVQRLNQELQNMNDQIQRLEIELNTAQKRIEYFQKQENTQQEDFNIKVELESLQNSKLNTLLVTRQEYLNMNNNKILELNEIRSVSANKIGELKNQVIHLEAELKHCKQLLKLEGQSQEHSIIMLENELKATNQQHESIVGQLHQQVKEFTEKNSHNQFVLVEKSNEIQLLNSQISYLERLLESQQQKFQEFNKEKRIQEDQMTRIIQKMQDEEQQVRDSFVSEIHRANEKAEVKKQFNEFQQKAIQSQYQLQQTKFKSNSSTQTEFSIQLIIRSKQIMMQEDFNQQNKQLRENYQIITTQNQSLKQEITELKDNFNTRIASVSDRFDQQLQSTLNIFSLEKTQLNEQINDLQVKLTLQETQLNDILETKEQLQQEIKANEQNLVKQSSSLDQTNQTELNKQVQKLYQKINNLTNEKNEEILKGKDKDLVVYEERMIQERLNLEIKLLRDRIKELQEKNNQKSLEFSELNLKFEQFRNNTFSQLQERKREIIQVERLENKKLLEDQKLFVQDLKKEFQEFFDLFNLKVELVNRDYEEFIDIFNQRPSRNEDLKYLKSLQQFSLDISLQMEGIKSELMNRERMYNRIFHPNSINGLVVTSNEYISPNQTIKNDPIAKQLPNMNQSNLLQQRKQLVESVQHNTIESMNKYVRRKNSPPRVQKTGNIRRSSMGDISDEAKINSMHSSFVIEERDERQKSLHSTGHNSINLNNSTMMSSLPLAGSEMNSEFGRKQNNNSNLGNYNNTIEKFDIDYFGQFFSTTQQFTIQPKDVPYQSKYRDQKLEKLHFQTCDLNESKNNQKIHVYQQNISVNGYDFNTQKDD